MAKELKTAEELAHLLDAELRKHDVCKDVVVNEVRPLQHHGDTNWTATSILSSGEPVVGDCSRVFLSTVDRLRQKYDLKRRD